MIKSKKQHFCCVETKELSGGRVMEKINYDVVRESEDEYTVSSEKEHVCFKASRSELLSCGYLC